MSPQQDPLQPVPDLHPDQHLLDHHGRHAVRAHLQLQPRVLLVRLPHLLKILPPRHLLLDVRGRLKLIIELETKVREDFTIMESFHVYLLCLNRFFSMIVNSSRSFVSISKTEPESD